MKIITIIAICLIGFSVPAFAVDCIDLKDCKFKLYQLENEYIKTQLQLNNCVADRRIEENMEKIEAMKSERENAQEASEEKPE